MQYVFKLPADGESLLTELQQNSKDSVSDEPRMDKHCTSKALNEIAHDHSSPWRSDQPFNGPTVHMGD